VSVNIFVKAQKSINTTTKKQQRIYYVYSNYHFNHRYCSWLLWQRPYQWFNFKNQEVMYTWPKQKQVLLLKKDWIINPKPLVLKKKLKGPTN